MELFLITETTILTMLDILPIAAILLFLFAALRERPPSLGWTCVVPCRFGRSFVPDRRYYGETNN